MQQNVSLAPYTTLRVGGPARYFFVAENEKDVEGAVSFAKKNDLPIFVLGGGSNILFSNDGFPGVVIKDEIGGITYENVDNGVRVTAGAGVAWDDLVRETVERSFYGLENLSLIPGTVGAAPIQNINAYGAHVGDVIESVKVFDSETMRMRTLSNEECEFVYRRSIFKNKRQFIVTKVTFILSRTGTIDCSYKDIKKYFERKHIIVPTLVQMRNAIVAIRTGKLPDVRKMGTAGSFFVHPIVSQEQAEKLKEKFPDLSIVPYMDGMVKIIAGRLLDMLGWKGAREGNVGTHQTHALAIVNYGTDNAQEIYHFAERMRKDAKEKTGIDLEFEVHIVGDFS